MRSWLLVALALLLLPSTAGAVTPDELIRLHAAGLGDEVLLALIDATALQGTIDANAAIGLRQDGLSDRVIAEAIRHQPLPDVVPAEEPPAPEPAAPIEPPPPETIVPGFVTFPAVVVPARRPHRLANQPTLVDPAGFGRFINTYFHSLNDGVHAKPAPDAARPEPRR